MGCFILVTTLWVFSVCLHEFGHAIVAYYGGDHTVVEKGYLKMNPLRYAHPVYSLLMPVVFVMLGGIGLPGGAVYIERDRIPSRFWQTGVSLAGPAMNLILVLIIALCFKVGWLPNDPQNLASVSFGFLMQLEISSILLCLLPIPPLDGFQAIAPWLPEETRERMFAVSNQSVWIVFLCLWYVPPLGRAFWDVVQGSCNLLGVDSDLGYYGYHAFRFWTRGY